MSLVVPLACSVSFPFPPLPACLFLLSFFPISVSFSPPLIPLADPQRESSEWVGLERRRSGAFYTARSSLARMEEIKTRERIVFSLSLSFSFFPPPLSASTRLPSLLSCLISPFCSPRIWKLRMQTPPWAITLYLDSYSPFFLLFSSKQTVAAMLLFCFFLLTLYSGNREKNMLKHPHFNR